MALSQGVVMPEQNNKDIRLINKSKRKNEFLTIHNKGYIRDIRLSLKAKGLLTLMLTNKDDWVIHLNEIAKHSSDGISSLYSGSKELILCKYIKKIQDRDEKGQFRETTYYIYDEPYDDSTIPLYSKLNNSDAPHLGNPHADKPKVDLPRADNRTLTNNNFNNNNIKKTEQTNYEQTVSESVLKNIIMELFNGDYPFDNQFESVLLEKLKEHVIAELNLKVYLSYVFERTKLANPMKSFSGLYRKLALSDSILRDFKMSNQFKKEEPANTATHNETNCECPICHTVFSVYDYYCPSCTLSVDAIKSNDMQEIKIKTKLFQMSEEERSQHNVAYQTFVSQKGRGFLTPEEQRQFYKDYGILN